jgi:DUF1365 family protein
MTAFQSALYAGKVMHQRLRPRRHRLSYRIFQLLLDLDEIDTLASGLRLFSHNRFNLFSFVDRDHGDGKDVSLKAYVERQLQSAGVETDGGPVRILCMPRMLGYAFNPLSIYFCHRRAGGLAAILYEVNNTFGQRHSYLIPVDDNQDSGMVEQQCAKRFYVSPFMAMDMEYRFRIRPPQERVSVHITGGDDAGPTIIAAFAGDRRPLSDALLVRVLFAYPLLTLKVVAGIHWQALLLWLKGMRLQTRPDPPSEPVTLVVTNENSRGKGELNVVGY